MLNERTCPHCNAEYTLGNHTAEECLKTRTRFYTEHAMSVLRMLRIEDPNYVGGSNLPSPKLFLSLTGRAINRANELVEAEDNQEKLRKLLNDAGIQDQDEWGVPMTPLDRVRILIEIKEDAAKHSN